MMAADFAEISVRSAGSLSTVPINLSLSVRDLKSLLSPSQPCALYCRGRILPSDSTLANAGISTGETIVVVPLPQSLSISVRSPSQTISIEISLFAAVSDLRTIIHTEFSLPIDQFTLIHSGHILCDHFTLYFQDIVNHCTVYVVPGKTAPKPNAAAKPRQKPADLVEKLQTLLGEYFRSRPAKQLEISKEISDLARNSILQSLARIDSNVKQLLEDALSLENHGRSRGEVATPEYKAHIQDVMMDQFELSHEGTNVLRKAVKQSRVEHIACRELSVVLDYEPGIGEGPLPVWWSCNGGNEEVRRKTMVMRELFSNQVRALKRMGFDDEAGILMALKENAGSVSGAAKFLRRTGNR